MLFDSICVHVELYLRQSTYSRISTQIDPPPVGLSVGDVRRQIAAEWLESAMLAMKSLQESAIGVPVVLLVTKN